MRWNELIRVVTLAVASAACATPSWLPDYRYDWHGGRPLQVTNRSMSITDITIRPMKNRPADDRCEPRCRPGDISWGEPWGRLASGQSAMFNLKEGIYDLQASTDPPGSDAQLVARVEARGTMDIVITDSASRARVEASKGVNETVIELVAR